MPPHRGKIGESAHTRRHQIIANHNGLHAARAWNHRFLPCKRHNLNQSGVDNLERADRRLSDSHAQKGVGSSIFSWDRPVQSEGERLEVSPDSMGSFGKKT